MNPHNIKQHIIRPLAAAALALSALLTGCVTSHRVADFSCSPFGETVDTPQAQAKKLCRAEFARHVKVDKDKHCQSTTGIYGELGWLSGTTTTECTTTLAGQVEEQEEKADIFSACMAKHGWNCEPVWQTCKAGKDGVVCEDAGERPSNLQSW